jgi:SAM-dependent methyltransferase
MHKEIRYKGEDNEEYWDRRWQETLSDADRFENLDIYPIRYSEMVVPQTEGVIAELGCGLGRLVKHYHKQGKNIVGVERSAIAVRKILEENPDLKVEVADVRKLSFPDNYFDVILAFGLFHNIEEGMFDATKEAIRCLKPGGRFCISMRPDNFEMRLNNYYWRRKHRGNGEGEFHKWLITRKEFLGILHNLDCVVDQVHRGRNVSILWRIHFFRKSRYVSSPGDTVNRAKGYELNMLGEFINKMLTLFFPDSFCNVLIFIGTKR